MSGQSVDVNELDGRLKELMTDGDGRVSVEDIREVVDSVMGSLQGELTSVDMSLYLELESLANYIDTAKKEIASLRPDEVNEEFIPSATNELDAIVDATAVATNTIMDCAEAIEAEVANVSPSSGDVLMAATVNIFEACGFQDITGQRITKVINTLKEIESRVDKLISAFGVEIAHLKEIEKSKGIEAKDSKVISDEDLLGGPQHSHEAKTQEEIDALLASFD